MGASGVQGQRRPRPDRAVLEESSANSSAHSTEHARLVMSLGRDVRFLHRAFSRVLNERLAAYGITGTQWTALRALWEQDGCSQVVLAQRMDVVKASLTTVLDGLERNGIVRRSQSEHDRRAYEVFLTKKGKALEKTLLPLLEEVNTMASQGLSDDEVRSFLRILWRMADNLK